MLKIITDPKHPLLNKVLKPVETFDKDLKKLVSEMEATMMAPDEDTEVRGVGLAANQIGVDKRIILVAFNVGGNTKDWKITTMINPEILEISQHQNKMEEGCLSLPGVFGLVKRPSKVKVRWQNLDGNWAEKKLAGWDARIFLHEFDHLEGKLFTEYLTPEALKKSYEQADRLNAELAAKKAARFSRS